jgi:alcohol dehydrogenase
MYSHCRDGGWLFGHTLHGLQAEYARVPHAGFSLVPAPDELTDEQMLFLADILPTAYECGTLNGAVQPGDVVAIVGAGPVGLAAAMLSRLYSPSMVISIDPSASRLKWAERMGADKTIQNDRLDPTAQVKALTEGEGVDVAIEAVGVPETLRLCADLVKPGGRIANIGVHGGPVTLPFERLWSQNVTLATRLVDTSSIPQLLKLIRSGRIDPTVFATHTFALEDAMKAYEVFAAAKDTGALKVVLKAS